MTKRNSGITRRTVITSLSAATLAAPFILRTRNAVASGPLVVVSWGGSYQTLLETIVAAPFTEETGIPVSVVSGPDIAKAKAQVMTGNLEWDVIDTSGPQIMSGERENLWEPLDTGIVDTSGLTVEATECTIPMLHYAGGIGYDPQRTPNPPRTFGELWDVESFPGRRAFRDRPHQTLEMALLADGVAPHELYPLDVERAFASLERIKPYVSHWISQTPQTISLVQNNEVDYSFTFNGRVANAKEAGISIEFSTEQTLLLTEYLAVLRGSPRKEAAMRFIAHTLRPDIQAKFSTAYFSIPTREVALADVSEDVQAALPKLDNPANVILSDQWWAENWSALDRRFKEWLAL